MLADAGLVPFQLAFPKLSERRGESVSQVAATLSSLEKALASIRILGLEARLVIEQLQRSSVGGRSNTTACVLV
jgi:hypothetical protein